MRFAVSPHPHLQCPSHHRVVPYIWVAVVICTVFGVVPWLIIELHHHRTEKHVIAWFVAGICTALTVPITVWDVAQHLTHWRNGSLQVWRVFICTFLLSL